MRPQLIQQFPSYINSLSCVVGICALLSLINLLADVMLTDIKSPPLPIAQLPKQKKIDEKIPEDFFDPIWQAAIFPPITEKKIPKPDSTPSNVKQTIPDIDKPLPDQADVPFLWRGVVAHSNPDKSFAVLLDTRNNKQMRVKIGETIEERYHVIEISRDEIKLKVGGEITVIRR